MKLTGLKTISQYRQNTEMFLGLNQADVISEGEFAEMQNLTSDKYPALATRGKRGMVRDIYEYFDAREIINVLEKNGKIYLVAKGEEGKFLFEEGKKIMHISYGWEMVSMGAYICIFPDKMWLNTVTGEYGGMEARFDFETAEQEANEWNENEEEDEIGTQELQWVKVQENYSWKTDVAVKQENEVPDRCSWITGN